ncbi:MAG: 30S ribosome-binding factor RbfA [Melioribacteraceae bacterium]|nr:30S ribosome-binding factor RbfA [Melioribacteraceae bacterium]
MSLRLKKIESMLKEELSLVFLQKLKDPVFGVITITDVKVSPDIKSAKVYVSVYEKEKRKEVLAKLNNVKKMVRTEIAHKVRMKHTPELNFFIDETLDYVDRMENLFKEINKDDNQETD